jgi:hypothetical protein
MVPARVSLRLTSTESAAANSTAHFLLVAAD